MERQFEVITNLDLDCGNEPIIVVNKRSKLGGPRTALCESAICPESAADAFPARAVDYYGLEEGPKHVGDPIVVIVTNEQGTVFKFNRTLEG